MLNINIDFGKKFLIILSLLFILTACPYEGIKKVNFNIKDNNLVFSVPSLDDYFNGEYICIINLFEVTKWDGKQFNTIWAFKSDCNMKLTKEYSLKENKIIYAKIPRRSIILDKPQNLTTGIYRVQGKVSAFYVKKIDIDRGFGTRLTSYCQLNIDSNGKLSVKKLSIDDLKELGIF